MLFIGVRGDCRDLRDRLRILGRLGELLELFGRHGNGLVDTALQIHRVDARGDGLEAFADDGLRHTVAVVVPSPASSEVLDATSFTICRAPCFPNLSLSRFPWRPRHRPWWTVERRSSCRALQLRPLGPSVTLTAFARTIDTPELSVAERRR